MESKRSSERSSQNVEHKRAKRKSSTGTVALVECVFCGEKERDLSKKFQKSRNYTQQGNTTQVFRVLMCSISIH